MKLSIMIGVPLLFLCVTASVLLLACFYICRAKAYEKKSSKLPQEDHKRVYPGRDWCGGARSKVVECKEKGAEKEVKPAEKEVP
jgi:hypothetical protein